MKQIKTLIQRQEEAIAEILSLRENGKRAMGYKLTLLNKSRRGLTRIRRKYFSDSLKAGYTQSQVEAQWNDIKDMALLYDHCES